MKGVRVDTKEKPGSRVAIVTGGAQGIGLGITRELLAAGWRVAAWDIDDEALAALNGEMQGPRDLLTTKVDVAQEEDICRGVEEAVQHFGRIDGVVNNAGITKPYSGPVQQLALSDWQKWIDVDLTGPLLVAKHSADHLTATQGAIVNIASTRALMSEPNSEAYAAAKGGLVALTHALAISLSGKVRVNCISPGWIAVEDFKKPAKREEPQLSETDHKQHPAGRVGHPADVASLCHFLLSDKAGFITGENIVVDGGMTRKMIYEE
ncbi:SDR family oxidoreductase [Proteobacteria bacterium 005FR1]|nr:SDR family oxidoreductase [Proteobacteria bacterium 005FR1]